MRLLVVNLLLVAALFFPGSLQAIVLDWSSVTWTAGSLSANYDIDPSNPGNDITITITGTTGSFNSGYPRIDTSLTGGTTPANAGLHLLLDFSTASQAITVSVAFNYAGGVNDVNFSLFDVDYDRQLFGLFGYTDQIRDIQATTVGGSIIGPSSVSGSSANTVSGTGTNLTVTGNAQASDTSSAGNAAISFGTNYITGFQFTYGNGSAPLIITEQDISLYDISYKPKVPEVGASAVAVLLCLGMAGFRCWQRNRRLVN